jgi:hypothetical protein
MQFGELERECRVRLSGRIGGIEFIEGCDQGLGYETSAVLAEIWALLVS